MKIKSIKKAALVIVLAFTLLTQIPFNPKIEARTPPQGSPQIPVVPYVPVYISNPINLQNAAVFAWQEFIALNWPAADHKGVGSFTRDAPNTSEKFGDPTFTDALVWHTFRSKVEIYSQNAPHGYVDDAEKSYGYDAYPPVYNYSIGQIPPFNGIPYTSTPWINLDENSQIGVDTMFAGVAPKTSEQQDKPVTQQILFLAKANRHEYNYVAANKWWYQQRFDGGKPVFPPLVATQEYIKKYKKSPPPASGNLFSPAGLVSFPIRTIEIKSAWRQLTDKEKSNKRFYMTKVRYYRPFPDSSEDKPHVGYVDDTWGLVALHIIQKIESSPFFIYATFSQANNLLDEEGNPIEDADGRLIKNKTAPPLDPDITSRNATSANPANQNSIQAFSPLNGNAKPGKRLYYINTPPDPPPTLTPQGIVALNKRKHDIPETIIQVNRAAHDAIEKYNNDNRIKDSPWMHYKLVSVQYQPYDKKPGITYKGEPGGPDPAVYYQANEVVESNYNLQVFSGQFQPGVSSYNRDVSNLITDYNTDGSVFKNTYYNGSGYLMGGCMGCHGNAQVRGGDFSFIFLVGPVRAPDILGVPASSSKFRELFSGK